MENAIKIQVFLSMDTLTAIDSERGQIGRSPFLRNELWKRFVVEKQLQCQKL